MEPCGPRETKDSMLPLGVYSVDILLSNDIRVTSKLDRSLSKLTRCITVASAGEAYLVSVKGEGGARGGAMLARKEEGEEEGTAAVGSSDDKHCCDDQCCCRRCCVPRVGKPRRDCKSCSDCGGRRC